MAGPGRSSSPEFLRWRPSAALESEGRDDSTPDLQETAASPLPAGPLYDPLVTTVGLVGLAVDKDLLRRS